VLASRNSWGLRKLLIVDPDVRLLSSYRDLLRPYGFEVLTAIDGGEATTMVECHPDIMLVIVDVVIDQQTGTRWIRWFNTVRAESPVIVISRQQVREDDEVRPTAILKKPFHVAELLDLVGLFCGLGTPTAARGI